MSDAEYTIMSPVMADHLNHLVTRLAQVARFCPSVCSHTVCNAFGYSTYGQKINQPPGKGGVSIALASVLGVVGQSQLVIVPSILSAAYYDNPDNWRSVQQTGTQMQAWSIVGNTSMGTMTVGPNYSRSADYAEVVAYYMPAKIDANGSSGYVPVGSFLFGQFVGSFGYEQDVLPYILWHNVQGIEVT